MVLEDVTRIEVEKYFRTRYDFEEAMKDQRKGLNDVKKNLSKVMQIKPRTLNEAYKNWKRRCQGEEIEDDSVEVIQIVSAIIAKEV